MIIKNTVFVLIIIVFTSLSCKRSTTNIGYECKVPGKDINKCTYGEGDIVRNRIFFLDSNYYNFYYKNYLNLDIDTNPKITKVHLLKLDPYLNYNTFIKYRKSYPVYYRIGIGMHRKLRGDSNEVGKEEYFLDSTYGFVILNNSLDMRQDQLLAYFETEDGKKSSDYYKYFLDSAAAESVSLNGELIHPYILCPQNLNAKHPQWKLSWKNVYELGVINKEKRNTIYINIKYQDPATQKWHESWNINGKETFLADFFGLTKNKMPEINNPDIYMFDHGLLVFPVSFGPQPFNSKNIPDNLSKNGKIYEYNRHECRLNLPHNYYLIEIMYEGKMKAYKW